MVQLRKALKSISSSYQIAQIKKKKITIIWNQNGSQTKYKQTWIHCVHTTSHNWEES